MGDPRRNEIFADFIAKQFPKAKSVLCVADGKGELGAALSKRGKRVRVIESDPRCSVQRKRRYRYEKGTFSSTTNFDEDLIVGMHPDEATVAIIKAAVNSGKPFAVVPCCHVLEDGSSPNVGSSGGWRNYLMKLANGALSTQLKKMTGRNIVIWHRGRKNA